MSLIKQKSSLMSVLAICALFVVLLSFLLPYVSVNFFGTHTLSGVDFIVTSVEGEEFPAKLAVVCPLLAVISMFCAFLAVKSTKASIGTIALSIVGMIVMIVAMADDDWDIIVAIDYASTGFYLFEVMNFTAIILSIASIYMGKNEKNGEDKREIVTNKKVCPKCKAEQDKNAAFCRFCGTPLTGGKITTHESGSKSINKKSKAICPHCGARNIEETEKCKYCGTSMDGSKLLYDKTVQKSSNIMTEKRKERVICPHCGARQQENAIQCKYCGTQIR